jgi:class 3 adenylate cyclase
MFSETRYARNGDLRVAYRASPPGERDIVYVPTWCTNCEIFPEMPSMQGWDEAMASLGRLIFLDQPGTGASDPVMPGSMPNLEQWADSITAVLDELGIDDAVLLAHAAAFPTAALFAATHPSRTSALLVLEGRARSRGDASLDYLRSVWLPKWGTGEMMPISNPDMPWNEEIRASWGRHERLAASPLQWSLVAPALAGGDVRALLPIIRVPTLVVHHSDGLIFSTEHVKYIADHIPGAKYVELPGRNMLHFVEPWRNSFHEIAQFLTGHQPDVVDDRVLATVLFTDIVDSTRRAAQMGDRDWRALLDAHDAIVRAQIARFRGREVKTSGDGFLAMFDGPQRAIRCAMAVRDAVHALGIEVRAGLHTGEVEIRGDDIGGIAVHIGARVSALAGANEVYVSSTLKDLVIGSGLEFDDRGTHQLKGVPGEWHLYGVVF